MLVRIFTAALLSVALAPAALAAPNATANATINDGLVELSWSDGGSERTRVSLVLPPEHECSSVELERDHRLTKVGLCRKSDPDATAPVLQFSVERTDTSVTPPRTLHLKADARLHRSAKVVIGRFEPSDWINELVATLR